MDFFGNLGVQFDFHTEYVVDDLLFDNIYWNEPSALDTSAFCAVTLRGFYTDVMRYARNLSKFNEPGRFDKYVQEHGPKGLAATLRVKNLLRELLQEIRDDVQADRALLRMPACVYRASEFRSPSMKIRLQAHERFHAQVGKHFGNPGAQLKRYSTRTGTRPQVLNSDWMLTIGLNQFGSDIGEGLAYISIANGWTGEAAYASAVEEALARVAELEAAYAAKNSGWVRTLRRELEQAVTVTRTRLQQESRLAREGKKHSPMFPPTGDRVKIPTQAFLMLYRRIKKKHGTIRAFVESL